MINRHVILKHYKLKKLCVNDKQRERAAHEHRIRELETEVALQSARAEATAAALRGVEDQRAADAAAVAEQHKEELNAAQSNNRTHIRQVFNQKQLKSFKVILLGKMTPFSWHWHDDL